jgi:DNA (cytosine-5)-methyltransferase 1
MAAYYNEIDPYAAQWLRNLIADGQIAPGEVDERSIVDVCHDDLKGFTQCHFFAGIGGWSIALRAAGWDDDRSVWTGSCPCQPFSAAGAGKAGDDERHLWPAWFSLIAQRRPAIIFGEQVEAAIGWGWLDLVFGNLEGESYACGAAVLPSCGVGAPHIRQRLWFVADANGGAQRGRPAEESGSAQRTQGKTPRQIWQRDGLRAVGSGGDGRMAHADGGDTSSERQQRGGQHGQQQVDGEAGDLADAAGGGQREQRDAAQPGSGGHTDRGGLAINMGDTPSTGREGFADRGRALHPQHATAERTGGDAGPPARFWQDAEWIACTDGKSRPIGPGSFPLAHGVQRRPSKLRAYGNAIVPQVAAEFIAAYLETTD